MTEPAKPNISTAYMDGCFDLVHYGHANAIREAKELADKLVVGIHSDADIQRNKGPPVYNEKERYQLIRAIKWVDQVVESAPFLTTMERLDSLGCDFIAHGDDISISSETGGNAYQMAIDAGRFREFKRTKGISTTDIVGRMLLLTKDHHERLENATESLFEDTAPKTRVSKMGQFAGSTKRIMEFSSGNEPKPGDRIVYTSGSFDLLHAGHVSFLEKVAKEGDYVIVGCHSDECSNWYKCVNRYKGSNFPIMNIHERVLALLSCRYVSEVFIGAPYAISNEIMDHFKIDVVVHGNTNIVPDKDGNDPFLIPRKLGKFKIIESGSDRTTTSILNAIIKNRLDYEERNQTKLKQESENSYNGLK